MENSVSKVVVEQVNVDAKINDNVDAKVNDNVDAVKAIGQGLAEKSLVDPNNAINVLTNNLSSVELIAQKKERKQDLLTESVHFGSVALCLKLKLYTRMDVLEYLGLGKQILIGSASRKSIDLLGHPTSKRIYVAYAAVCQSLKDLSKIEAEESDGQYIGEGVEGYHFLKDQPQFKYLYELFGFNMNAPISLFDKDGQVIADGKCIKDIEFTNEPQDIQFCNFLAAGTGSKRYCMENRDYLYLLRSPLSSKFGTNRATRGIRSDWFGVGVGEGVGVEVGVGVGAEVGVGEVGLSCKHGVTVCLKRARYLKQHVPTYYEAVRPVFLAAMKSIRGTNFGYNQLDAINEVFPEVFEDIKYLPLLCRRIAALSIYNQAYLLGYQFDRYMPSKGELMDALQALDAVCVERYVASMSNDFVGLSSLSPELTKIFEEAKDHEGQHINTYSPFDVVLQRTNEGGLNIYSRSNWRQMVKNIDRTTVKLFHNLDHMAMDCFLIAPASLLVTYKRIEDGWKFKELLSGQQRQTSAERSERIKWIKVKKEEGKKKEDKDNQPISPIRPKQQNITKEHKHWKADHQPKPRGYHQSHNQNNQNQKGPIVNPLPGLGQHPFIFPSIPRDQLSLPTNYPPNVPSETGSSMIQLIPLPEGNWNEISEEDEEDSGSEDEVLPGVYCDLTRPTADPGSTGLPC